MKRAHRFVSLALVPPSASSFVLLRKSFCLLCRAHTALGVRLEGLNRDMDPNRNEPIAIHFTNREPDAFQTTAAYSPISIFCVQPNISRLLRPEISSEAKPCVIRRPRKHADDAPNSRTPNSQYFWEKTATSRKCRGRTSRNGRNCRSYSVSLREGSRLQIKRSASRICRTFSFERGELCGSFPGERQHHRRHPRDPCMQ
jgi:hypothetical protein